jgi:hypothetical protein
MADNNAPKAKKLSPETEAIIDRLKREGQLTRNSEGNSIKSIKINLEKFADAFTAIQKSTEDTARIMTENFVDGNTEILKKVDETLEGMTDEQKKAEIARRKEAKLQAVADKETKREQTFGLNALGSNLKGLGKGIKDGLMGIKKDPWGTLLNIGKWALVIPLLAGAIKGVLDLIFGEEKVAEVYRKVNEVGTKFINFLKDPNWGIILGGLAAFSLLNWAKLYGEMLLMARALGVKGGMGGGTDVLTTGGDGKKTSRKDKFKKILGKAKGKGGLLIGTISLVTIGGVQYMMGDDEEPIDLTADIARINAAGDAEDAATTKKLVDTFENERKGFGTILTETLTGAAVGGAMGGIFGMGAGAIPGAIAGAIFGAVSGIGQVGFDFVDDVFNDVDKIPNELEKALKNEKSKNKLHLMYGREDAAAELTANTTARVKEIIDGLTTSNIGLDTNIKAMEDSLAGEITAKSTGIGRNKRTDEYVMFGGELVKVKEINERLEKAKKERLLREQQLITSRKILEMRTGELQAVEASVEQTNNLNDQVDEVAAKAAAAKPIDIEPAQTEERERKQHVAAGGFALNIVNNYYNKGGDTVVQNQADNRVNSTKNTAIAASGVGGSSRFSGGVGLPTGQMA